MEETNKEGREGRGGVARAIFLYANDMIYLMRGHLDIQ